MITSQRLLRNGLSVAVSVETNHDLGQARSLAVAAAQAQGFDQTDEQRVRLVATEMATSLVQHAWSGRICVRLLQCGERGGVELVATDRGPGMPATGTRSAPLEATVDADVGGQGTMTRISDLFDLYAAPGRGTVMMSRLWGKRPSVASEGQFLVGSMMEPKTGEEISGDAWAVEQSGSRAVALVADGLGYGVDAAAASAAAVKAFRQRYREPVTDIVGHIHRALRGTRGAAVAVAEIDAGIGRLRFCGIGNISARLFVAGTQRNLISEFGIAGYQAPKIRAYDEDWAEGAMLVMHSDGLSTSWDFSGYSGLLGHHPQLAAATVMRDAPRATDDALVLALRRADKATATTTVEAR